ncbi:ZIP family metal transporter [Parapedobacter lycopersici]|uniref:ZIP family metal transporter n=1 Tax=Parapedobacter lycopersici TaxID=1864939 RepID=UPI00214D724A|nr:ZIP family metal transporter [Parapedobacter lycopersici]
MNDFSIFALLFASAFASGIAVFFVKRDNTNTLKLVLSFTGAYLFSITVLDLFPHVYYTPGEPRETIGIYVLTGFFFQLVLEQFSHGVEHGHLHHTHESRRNVFPLGIMLSLCLHALLEGMPLAARHQNELVFGIALHHVPAAFALGSLLIHTSLSKRGIILLLILFSIMTPLGFLLSKGISSGGIGNIERYFDRIMAMVIGVFLHISTTILFESGSADHHKFNRRKMIAVVLGIMVALANFLINSGGHRH